MHDATDHGGLEARLIQATLRVPARAGAPSGRAENVARQADAALLTAGFACSRELLEHIAGLEPGAAIDTAVAVLAAVRGLAGGHVDHNVYFADFPANVPDTLDFWADCLARALVGAAEGDDEDAAAGTDAVVADPTKADAAAEGADDAAEDGHPGADPAPRPDGVNLLGLPAYGRYQHTYADLLLRHDDLVASAKDRVTVLHLGGPLPEEAHRHYLRLAASPVPLGEADRDLLGLLAAYCVDDPQPEEIGIRENRALVNRVRLAHGRPLLVDTATDVLRLACALSGGDVTLATPTRFTSLPRADRRALMAALDRVVAGQPAKLGDVNRHAGRWKRLGERLHPHEHPEHPHAQEVFAVARGDRRAVSLAGRIEAAFAAGDTAEAVRLLAASPGQLVRNLDRLLRTPGTPAPDATASGKTAPGGTAPDAVGLIAGALAEAAPHVAGRVLVGAREHLSGRTGLGGARLFANRSARAWVAPDDRVPLGTEAVARVTAVLDAEIAARLPAAERVLVDPDVLEVAVPSARAPEGGLGMLPRGSTTRVDGDHLRFFVYWRQAREITDLDLSVLFLDAGFGFQGQVSWTSLSGYGGTHSGDIVEASEGATEMIDLDLARVSAAYVVPQVNVFQGEGFAELAEGFFGYMTRDADQAGMPFEARTVRVKSDLVGTGRVVLPLVFARDPDTGGWRARWMHLSLSGQAAFNRVEDNHADTGALARAIVEYRYLTIGHLVESMRHRGARVEIRKESPGRLSPGDVYLGLEHPEDLGDDGEVFTPARFPELIGG
ncbi:TerD family protein [Streptomonospora sp. S1-112]|uniref:TerD family protein n=1 Tax=Streptomonospora mangrovi TaxID=2883123 RepID=A0A9X3NK46_9ACTN|nr:TerD family protein [Streptomonospora mangrovi]MDA0564475.1 TerD family protein [Streptomonospora mangrovi]